MYQTSLDISQENNRVERIGATYCNLGILYSRQGMFAEAEEMLSGSIQRNEKDKDAWADLGRVYVRTGRFENAEEAYSNSISLDHYDRQIHEELESLYIDRGMVTEAKAQAEVMKDLFEGPMKCPSCQVPYSSVDQSIREHIRALNDLGLETYGCCSGLEEDHPDREAHEPYVGFTTDNPRACHWLFTIADMARWKADYG